MKNCRGRARVLNCSTLDGRKSYSVWKDDVESDLKEIGIVSWRLATQDRDGWRKANIPEVTLLG